MCVALIILFGLATTVLAGESAPTTIGVSETKALHLAPADDLSVAEHSPESPGEQDRQPRGIFNDKLATQLITAGCILIPMDESIVDGMARTPVGQGSDDATELANSLGDGMVLLPLIGGIYLLGDDRERETARLAFAAFLNAGMITHGVKMLAGRERPAVSGDQAVFHGPTTDSGFMSFPSGHTSVAFAVAAVLANRDPRNDWLYYSLAAAVGWARVRKSAHFPSDVLVGAGIGVYSGNSALRDGPSFLSIKF